MALNFPSAPSEGQKFSGFVFTGGLWKSAPIRTALPFNYFVNPAMQISQEHGDTAGTGNGRFGADQWVTSYSSTAVITTQRVQVVTPNGSKNRYRTTISTADAALAAGEYAYVGQWLEGVRVADLMWGTASAKQIVVRFGFKGPAGTYAFGIRNGAGDRTYVANFTIAAGQADIDTEQIIVVPGDTAGVWLKDTGYGMMPRVALAAGTTYHATNNAWNAGNFLGAAGISNGMATISAVFELFDLGLYADPYLTGKPPPWEMPIERQAMMDSQRYFSWSTGAKGWAHSTTYIGRSGSRHPVPMRGSPSVTVVGTPIVYTANTHTLSTMVGSQSNYAKFEADWNTTGVAMTVGRAVALDMSPTNHLNMNARM